jgi:hypothetical protein
MWDLDPNVVLTDLPRLPAAATLDYLPMAGMAHAALPFFDDARGVFVGNGRIWLKGSPTCRRAIIEGTSESVALEAPWYTAVVEAPPGEATVACAVDGPRDRSVRVSVPDAATLNDAGKGFSALD